jgi:hypothetical protein
MSITPSLPGQAKGVRFEHGSVLGGKIRAARVSSQRKSTACSLGEARPGSLRGQKLGAKLARPVQDSVDPSKAHPVVYGRPNHSCPFVRALSVLGRILARTRQHALEASQGSFGQSTVGLPLRRESRPPVPRANPPSEQARTILSRLLARAGAFLVFSPAYSCREIWQRVGSHATDLAN